MNIDKIVNLRAQLAEAGGIQKLKASGDLYDAMQEFLNTPVCPLCGREGNPSSGPTRIKPGIDGFKCPDCFKKRLTFVNFVFRKDLKEEKAKLGVKHVCNRRTRKI